MRQDLGARRTLKCEQTGFVAAVADDRVVQCEADAPAVVLLNVGRVHTQENRVVSRAIERHVIDDAAFLVAEESVANASRLERRDRSAQQSLGGCDRAGALQVDLAHVGDVEEASSLAYGAMLLQDRSVLDGHRIAGELHETGPEPLMGTVQGGALEIGHAPKCAS